MQVMWMEFKRYKFIEKKILLQEVYNKTPNCLNIQDYLPQTLPISNKSKVSKNASVLSVNLKKKLLTKKVVDWDFICPLQHVINQFGIHKFAFFCGDIRLFPTSFLLLYSHSFDNNTIKTKI